MLSTLRRGAAAVCLAAVAAGTPPPAEEPVTVFAAASLKNAFEDAAAAFTAETRVPLRFSFAASSQLARQIEQGAPADLFASADQEWMDYLAERRLIKAETRLPLLGNRLVLVAPADGPDVVALDAAALAAALGDGRLVTGEVTSVPVGRYAKAALEKLGLWAQVQPRLAMADNVRAALAFVARGEARLGIVYATDAAAEPKVKVVATFPAESHPAIVYPVAVTATGRPEAGRFIAFLRGPAAAAIFARHGFSVLPGG
jgi:molybdate transport system substrate-binding protein